MPFVKGQSGNPKGRKPKDREVEYSNIVQSACSTDDWLKICRVAVSQAERGDAVARKWLSDNLIGLPVQKNEITGKDGGNLEIGIKAIDYRVAIADLTTRSEQDSDTSGEDQTVGNGKTVG